MVAGCKDCDHDSRQHFDVTHLRPPAASPPASARSPSRPPSPSTPRPRPSRRPAGPSSASAPASRTSRRPPTSSRRRSRRRRTPSTTATRPRPACPSCARRSPPRPRATPATTSSAARCWSPTAASRRSTTPSPTLLDPGDEVLLPAPYWTTYPESIRLAGGVPVEVIDRRVDRLPRRPRRARGRRSPRAPRRWSSSRRPTRPARSTRRPRSSASAAGRVERGIWVVTDEIYEHLVYGSAEFASMPALVPELADRCVVVNGVAKTYAMTGWRVGWMIGPADVIDGGHQPAVPRHLQRQQRRPGGRAGRRVRRPVRRGRDAGGLRPPPADDGADAQRDPRRRRAPSRRAPSTATPASRSCSARELARSPARRARRELCELRAGGGGGGRGARARPSARPATSGCRTPWATTTWPRAWAAGKLLGKLSRRTSRRLTGTGLPRPGAARPSRAAQGAPAPALHRVAAPPHAGRAGRRARRPAAGRADQGVAAAAAGTDERGLVPLPAAVRHGARRRPRRGGRAPAAARGGRGRARRGLALAGDPGRPHVVRAAAGRADARGRDRARRRPRGRREATGVGIGIVIAANRTRHPLEARTLARLAAQYAGQGVIGFGLSNDERRGAAEDFERAFAIARRAGLLSVPHGGELAGPRSVAACLDVLGAARVGHGVRSVEDPGAARPAAAAGRHAGGVPGLQRRRSACTRRSPTCRCGGSPTPGCGWRLGADDPLLFGSRLLDQYEAARDVLGLRRRVWPSWPAARSGARRRRGDQETADQRHVGTGSLGRSLA